MNANSIDRLKFPTIPLLVGVISGLLTAEMARLAHPENPLIAFVFGLGLVLLVWLKYNRCAVWFVIAIVASSVAAYFVAVWGTMPLLGVLSRLFGPESGAAEPLGPAMFAIAGFLGAFTLSLVSLLLLSRPRTWRILGKAAAFSLAGAFLAFLGVELSGLLGPAIARVVGDPPTLQMGRNDYYLIFYSTYLVWQIGMAFLFPLMLPHTVHIRSSITRRLDEIE